MHNYTLFPSPVTIEIVTKPSADRCFDDHMLNISPREGVTETTTSECEVLNILF